MKNMTVVVGLIVGLLLGFTFGRTALPGVAGAAPRPQEACASGNCGQGGAQAPRPSGSSTVFRVPVEGSPARGRADARVTLVEFSDYECPFCSRAHATVQQLQQRYGDKLRVVMKNNPLPMHPHAQPAALAALAAGEQGKFWEYHDVLFAHQRELDDASLERYAKEAGLDVARWKRSLADPRLAERIRQDQALSARLGANGTPAFFINGRQLVGAQPVETFQALIDEELQKPAQPYEAIIARGVDGPPAAAEPAVQRIEVGTSPARGPKDAPVTLVVFSDFECPFCGRAEPTVHQLENEYQGKLRVVFKNQPLPMHANARPAALAALAANEQGKFWEFHDVLFDNQRALDRASLEKYAQQAGLDVGRFRAALDSGKFDAQLSADMAEASRVGVTGTPTFFINGRQLVGAQPVEQFRRLIDEELGKAGKGGR